MACDESTDGGDDTAEVVAEALTCGPHTCGGQLRQIQRQPAAKRSREEPRQADHHQQASIQARLLVRRQVPANQISTAQKRAETEDEIGAAAPQDVGKQRAAQGAEASTEGRAALGIKAPLLLAAHRLD